MFRLGFLNQSVGSSPWGRVRGVESVGFENKDGLITSPLVPEIQALALKDKI